MSYNCDVVGIKRSNITNATKSHEAGLVEFLSELVKTPSVNGEHKEQPITKVIATRVKKLGLPHEILALDAERPNIFVGTDFNKKSGLLFVAHLDTVPTGDQSKWRHNPFGADIEGGKLYGRGAIDCKAGIALSIYTLKILYDLGKQNVAKFAGVVDEESGADSKLGARYMLDKGLSAQNAIYTYPGVETVTIGHRGLVRLWIEAHGESAHTGSKNWQDGTRGANAIDALCKFINRLSEISMSGTHGAFPGYTFKHTPTLVQGGNSESIVPDIAKVLVDARLLPNYDNRKYIRKMEALASDLASGKITFDVRTKTNIPGVAISPNERIVQTLKKLDEEIMGIKPELRGSGPASEGYMFVKSGIPTICGFGAEGDGVHSADEYVKLESLPKILEMYIVAALELSS